MLFVEDALSSVMVDGEAMGARAQAWVREECSWHAFDERLDRLVALAARDAKLIGVPA